MRKRLWPLAHAALTLACAGCCAYLLWREGDRSQDRHRDTGRRSEGADVQLRQFQQVKWMGGDYELPPGQDHCAAVLLEFEDGRFVGQHGNCSWSAPAGGQRVVPYMVMWGPTAQGPRWMTFSGNGFWMSGSGDDFWAKVDGPVGRAAGTSDYGELRGYRVIGFGASMQMRAGHEDRANVGINDATVAVSTRKYVAVLGIKTFGSDAEANNWANGTLERVDPPAP